MRIRARWQRMRPLVPERQGRPVSLRNSVQGLFRCFFRFKHHVPDCVSLKNEAWSSSNEPGLLGDEIIPCDRLKMKHSHAEAAS